MLGVMFRFHKKLPIDFFLENKIGSICLGFQLQIWLIFLIQGCTKMQLDFGKKKSLDSCKCCKKKTHVFSTNKKKTNNQKQTTICIYIYILIIRNDDSYNCDSILHDKNYAKRK